jgi:hypothetical protein
MIGGESQPRSHVVLAVFSTVSWILLIPLFLASIAGINAEHAVYTKGDTVYEVSDAGKIYSFLSFSVVLVMAIISSCYCGCCLCCKNCTRDQTIYSRQFDGVSRNSFIVGNGEDIVPAIVVRR